MEEEKRVSVTTIEGMQESGNLLFVGIIYDILSARSFVAKKINRINHQITPR